jgi:hypothetical protein
MSIFRVTFSGLLWGNVWNNVVHFASGGNPALSAIAAELETSWVGNVKQFQHTQLQYTDIGVKDVGSSPGPAAFHRPVNVFGNSSAATSNDSNLLTMVLKLGTSMAGPRGRGRVLVAGVPQARFNLGLVQPSILTTWQTIANNIMAVYGPGGSSGQGLGIVVTSRSNPGNYLTVVSMIVRVSQGTCRSRAYGVGI